MKAFLREPSKVNCLQPYFEISKNQLKNQCNGFIAYVFSLFTIRSPRHALHFEGKTTDDTDDDRKINHFKSSYQSLICIWFYKYIIFYILFPLSGMTV